MTALRGRRLWRVLAVALVLIAGALVVLWAERRTIARGFVDQALARQGVAARYRIERLSPWNQRLTHVVLGDPAHPDLTAEQIDLRTSIAPWSLGVLVVRARGVRLHGRIVDGALSLGSIDRLLPAPSGKPLALPHLRVDLDDTRIALDTGGGAVTLAVTGRGMLDDGFRGIVEARAARLAAGACDAAGLAARLRVDVRGGAPRLSGPLSAARLDCNGVAVARAGLRVTANLGAAFDRWRGTAALAAGQVTAPAGSLAEVRGQATFDGGTAGTQGQVALRSAGFSADAAQGRTLAVQGTYRQAGAKLGFDGSIRAQGVALRPAMLSQVGTLAAGGAGTPLAPLTARLAQALAAAGRDFDAGARLSLTRGTDLALGLQQLEVRAASGARLRFDRGAGIALAGGAPATIDGMLAMAGGGLPAAELRFSRRAGSDAVQGGGTIAPYAAGGASLALADVAFRVGAQAGDARARATLSGPLPGGRVERLMLPLALRWDARGWRLNPGCADARFARLDLGGATLGPARLGLCPLGGAMARGGAGGIGGGVRLAPVALDGRMGDRPLHVATGAATLDLGASGFDLRDAAVRLGSGDALTRLDIAALSGRLGKHVEGRFEGLSGQIGGVPLVMAQGSGTWDVADGALGMAGDLLVSDAEPQARFAPMHAEGATLRLAGDELTADAALTPQPGTPAVARVHIAHRLAEAAGTATIDVPGIAFAPGGRQPSDLTPLTFGVIADVRGTVSGQGRIDWTPEGVTSSGDFGTDGLDLAAAFGPVQGLATHIAFTDLLAMRTAPDQVATVASINPGVPVEKGTVHFRLLDAQHVDVSGGRWPFAGGELVLEPTLLDFTERQERHMTFRVTGADAALFLKEMDFDNMDAAGSFDGTLPMIFDQSGGRIEGGMLKARDGGSLAYVGEISQRDVGFWGNMAFQALKSLKYRELAIQMNGPLAGEMITEIRFAGVSQGKGARSNFLLRRLARLPFVFNVRIRAPFKQLLDSVQSWYEPSRLIERNLPALIEEQKRAAAAARAGTDIQPRESENVP